MCIPSPAEEYPNQRLRDIMLITMPYRLLLKNSLTNPNNSFQGTALEGIVNKLLETSKTQVDQDFLWEVSKDLEVKINNSRVCQVTSIRYLRKVPGM